MCVYRMFHSLLCFCKFTAVSEIYTLSLHDALPILVANNDAAPEVPLEERMYLEIYDAIMEHRLPAGTKLAEQDRKSTRLNSSHSSISYAVFCLKKKTEK